MNFIENMENRLKNGDFPIESEGIYMNILVLYVILSVSNVIIQTIKSIATIKCGKVVASIVNAIAYGLYTVVLVYTNADFPLWEKVIVTAVANLIGVFIVKVGEEKAQKEQLLKFEVNVKTLEPLRDLLENTDISYNCIETSKGDYQFNIFCETKADSTLVREMIAKCNGKYFVTMTRG